MVPIRRCNPLSMRRVFIYMDNPWNPDLPSRADSPEAEQTRTTTQARQAVSGVGVRYVLAISLSAALALMAVAYFFYAGP
jgi:hypothetical protein